MPHSEHELGSTKATAVRRRKLSVFRRMRPLDAMIEDVAGVGGIPMRRLLWPSNGAPRGTLLFAGGRADFFEKYMESLGHWHREGWTITSFDWPGQAGSGRRLGNDLGHSDGYEDWVATLALYWHQEVMRLPGPHVIVAHSMGGHLVTRALLEGAIRPDAAALTSPMFGLLAHVPRGIAHFLSQGMSRIGFARRAGPGVSKDELDLGRQNILTADQERYADEIYWRDKDLRLRTGAPTWGWIAASYRSIRKLRNTEALGDIDVPMLILFSGQDQLVDPADTRRVIAAIPDADGYEYTANAAHELLREVDAVRDDVLRRIDAFFAEKAAAH